MTLEDAIHELYRLAETKAWEGSKSDEALSTAIEGLEKIWELQQADKRKSAIIQANRKQPRVWC